MILSAPFCLKPLRKLLGNRITAFLASISMNYYLIHQTLAVHMRRIGFPASVAETPNMAGEQPWQTQYTLLAFGLSLVAAVLVTYLIEKPAGKWLKRKFG
jgi:peptidoglycan/LPS O-acetylase OafA/YrhL